MLDTNDTTHYDLSGVLIYDPVLGNDVVQDAVTTVPFVDYHHNLMPFNSSFSQHIHDLHESCGFAAYQDKYLTYPPPGPQPSNYSETVNDECVGLWELVLDNALSVNPCFDVYQVATTCPLLWDVLGFPGSFTVSNSQGHFPSVLAAFRAQDFLSRPRWCLEASETLAKHA